MSWYRSSSGSSGGGQRRASVYDSASPTSPRHGAGGYALYAGPSSPPSASSSPPSPPTSTGSSRKGAAARARAVPRAAPQSVYQSTPARQSPTGEAKPPQPPGEAKPPQQQQPCQQAGTTPAVMDTPAAPPPLTAAVIEEAWCHGRPGRGAASARPAGPQDAPVAAATVQQQQPLAPAQAKAIPAGKPVVAALPSAPQGKPPQQAASNAVTAPSCGHSSSEDEGWDTIIMHALLPPARHVPQPQAASEASAVSASCVQQQQQPVVSAAAGEATTVVLTPTPTSSSNDKGKDMAAEEALPHWSECWAGPGPRLRKRPAAVASSKPSTADKQQQDPAPAAAQPQPQPPAGKQQQQPAVAGELSLPKALCASRVPASSPGDVSPRAAAAQAPGEAQAPAEADALPHRVPPATVRLDLAAATSSNASSSTCESAVAAAAGSPRCQTQQQQGGLALERGAVGLPPLVSCRQASSAVTSSSIGSIGSAGMSFGEVQPERIMPYASSPKSSVSHSRPAPASSNARAPLLQRSLSSLSGSGSGSGSGSSGLQRTGSGSSLQLVRLGSSAASAGASSPRGGAAAGGGAGGSRGALRVRPPPGRPLQWWLCGGLAVAAAAGGAVAAVYGVMTYVLKVSMVYSLAWKAATGVAAAEGLAIGGWSVRSVRVEQAATAAATAELARLRARAEKDLALMRALLKQTEATHSHEVASLAALNERLSKLASSLRVENSGLQGALDRAAAERQCLEAAAALESCRVHASASERVVAEVAGVSRGQAQLVALVQELREDLMGLVPAAHASSAAAEGGVLGGAGRAASAPSALPAVTVPPAEAAAAAAAAPRRRSQSEPLAAAGAGAEEAPAAPGEATAGAAVRVASVRGGVNSALAATVCDTLAL